MLKIAAGDFDATRLSPPARVDEAWHLHVLETKHYSADCVAMCGRVVHHDPDGGDDASARATRIEATKKALRRVYGDRYDKTIWAWPTPAPARKRAAPKSSKASRKRATAVEAGDSLNIRVRSQTSEETFFKVRTTTKLSKVFDAYAERTGIAASSFRFLFDGRRLYGYETPADIGLAEGGQIDTMLDQRGCSPLDHHPRT